MAINLMTYTNKDSGYSIQYSEGDTVGSLRILDYVGKKYVESDTAHWMPMYECECGCGNTTIKSQRYLNDKRNMHCCVPCGRVRKGINQKKCDTKEFKDLQRQTLRRPW